MRVCRRETALVALLCAGWYAAGSASSVLGKLVLARFPFPVTLTVAQLLCAALLSPAALAAARVRPEAAPPAGHTRRVLLPLACAKLLTTLCSQLSLWKVPVSYAHTVKATTPLWTAGLAYVLFGEPVSAGVRRALAMIACGVGVASLTEAQWSGAGLGAALAAAALLSLQQLYSKRALRGTHPLRLLLALSRLALVPLAPLWLWAEGGALWARGADGASAALVVASGALAWLQAVLALAVLARVSPLGYAVASAAKRVVVVGASLLVLRNPASAANVAGMLLAAGGVLAYQRARLQRPPAHTLPV